MNESIAGPFLVVCGTCLFVVVTGIIARTLGWPVPERLIRHVYRPTSLSNYSIVRWINVAAFLVVAVISESEVVLVLVLPGSSALDRAAAMLGVVASTIWIRRLWSAHHSA